MHRPYLPPPTPAEQLAYAGKPFIINRRVIRTDSAGRFCLNDLHKEAGGRPKDAPYFWKNLDSTKDLITTLEASKLGTGFPVPQAFELLTSRMGSSPGNPAGTFAVKELVYDYAMWISPEFKLIVIRVFDRLIERGLLDNGMPDLFGANKEHAQPVAAPIAAPLAPALPSPGLVIPAANPSLKLAGDLLSLLLATRDSIPSALVARYLEEAKR